MAQKDFDKWEALKRWIIKRHDYFEKEYLEHGISSDASDLGAFRSVFNTMKDLESREWALKQRAQAPKQVARPQ